MTLHHWQQELAGLVLADGSRDTATFGSELSAVEVASLESARDAPGLKLTIVVQKWWRAFRIRAPLPLTIAYLGDEADTLVDAFLDVDREPSSFFLHEALGFLSFLSDQDLAQTHLAAVTAFERSMLVLTQLAAEGTFRPPTGRPSLDRPLRRHPAATAITFWAPPAEVITALLLDQPLPGRSGEPHVLIMAAHLPHCCRAGTDRERQLLEHFGNGARAMTLPGWEEGDRPLLGALWEAGAVIDA